MVIVAPPLIGFGDGKTLVKVGAVLNAQFKLFCAAPSVLVKVIREPPEAFESVVSAQFMAKVPLAVNPHLVPGLSETRLTLSLSSIPCRVKSPATV